MALPININELIHGGTVESERIEFKEGFNDEELVHSICAFANDLNNWGGGYIVIGIREDKGRPVLPPLGLNDNQVEPYQNELVRICHFVEPLYFPLVAPYKVDGRNILVIWIPGGDNRPYKAPISMGKNQSQKAYYVRRMSTTTKASAVEERRLLELTARIPFDDRISHFGKLSDIEIPLIESYLKEIQSDLSQEVGKLTPTQLCRNMEIVRGPNEDVRPLNIGLMMFSSQPEKFFKGAVIDIVIHGDTTGTKFIEKSFKGALAKQLRDALQYIKVNVIQEQVIKVSDEERSRRIVNYPFAAVEEALANAVYHRSYEDDRHIEVNVFTNKIELVSYPGPLPPVDQEALLQERVVARDYRNRRIGEYLKELKLCEGRGTGIPTIRTKMRDAGCPIPDFIPGPDNTYFLTVLKINSEWDLQINPKSEAFITLTNIEQLILEQCTDNALTIDELQKSNASNSKKEISGALESLARHGYIGTKKIRKLFGLITVRLFFTTGAGKDARRQSF